jgi:serine/threonine protein kinase
MDVDLIESEPEFKTILEQCLNPDYNKRPTAEELFNNPFFAGYTEL